MTRFSWSGWIALAWLVVAHGLPAAKAIGLASRVSWGKALAPLAALWLVTIAVIALETRRAPTESEEP